ncbi:formylmethanofuran dehydrogenase subunit C [Limimaricola variabilis]|uniref:Formylmethanofuran dehydrogenase subunit C n=1 Tax=Limimaricola variabilis TaxID=1492771 RepID=A0ABR6HTN2_9RHOB|nr:hypothetical protein [Limimaricola variabilis]MBB3713831.1 formylmethanofuran dehydrogenase subunit C [Limimaricola variabilis]
MGQLTQLLAIGGVSFSSNMQMHGGQIITRGDAIFTSNALGKGASIIAGGKIDGTSNMEMMACDERGMEDNLHIDHYRLAE